MTFTPKVLAGPAALLALGAAASAAEGPVAPAPSLQYAFTATVSVAAPVEQGEMDGGRRRFIAITGGTVRGPMLTGTVLAGGGDWQTILPGGLTTIEARYFLRAADGTVIEVTNPGVRTGTPEVIARLVKGESVDPGEYYFRTTPRFTVPTGAHDWLRRSVFVARGGAASG